MAYSQAVVLAGGIAHVPILITALKFLDSKTLKLHNSKAEAIAKEKAVATKAAAVERMAKEKAQAAQAAQAAKAAQAEIKVQPPSKESDSD